MITCSKLYTDIPFAHRQHLHGGHCSKIHGHNWSIKLTFGCLELDSKGFVVDFGKLKYIKEYIDDNLDHACVLSKKDIVATDLIWTASDELFKIYWVDNASCEGIAEHLLVEFSKLLNEVEGDRVWIDQIEVAEDSKNSVIYINH
tara:strand:- start:854 stop:1288 length:435 start_codon:yes stop_codon:yes gene_type:complete